MHLRRLVLIVAAVGIPVALLLLVLPMTWGYGGYRWIVENERAEGVITYVDPHGPAARAGLREGERVKLLNGAGGLINDAAGPVGTVERFLIAHNGRVRQVTVKFVPYGGTLAAQQQLGKILNALTAFCGFLVAILVLLRGRNIELASRAAYVLLLAGTRALCQGLGLVVYYAIPADLCEVYLPGVLLAMTLWSALGLLTVFPREGNAFRKLLARAGLAGVLFVTAAFLAQFAFDAGFLQLSLFANLAWAPYLPIPLLAISIVHAMARAKDAETVPMRWLGTMWLAALFVQALPRALVIAHMPIGASHYFDGANALFVFLLSFGIAYPILRHRMIDLNIFVSTATVFTVVSLILVGVFVAAEWSIGKIFEHSLGFSNDRGGLAAQAATLAIVLLLGISARSIHSFVEGRLSKLFFRKRLAALREIERVAHETDAATSPSAVLSLTVDTVQRSLQPLGVALYLREDDRYVRARESGDAAFAPIYDFNDRIPLRLRRWQVPFEVEHDTQSEQHALFLPMTFRGEVLGFLACGPKADHTAYLPDEIAALSLLAHHAGITSAWLSRPATLPALRLTPSL